MDYNSEREAQVRFSAIKHTYIVIMRASSTDMTAMIELKRSGLSVEMRTDTPKVQPTNSRKIGFQARKQ